ncbi:MAG: GNAT family protein [Bacteroidota bacterium]
MHWITYPTSLSSEIIDLIPLEKEHFPELIALSEEEKIWQFYLFDGANTDVLLSVLNKTLLDREQGTQFPFVVYHKVDKKIIGSTRLMDIQAEHKKLEIGATWIHPEYWGTPVNLHCKLLLLQFCFEKLQAIRVLIKTDANNIRSRRAIEKLGAHFEGVLRQDMIRHNGIIRSTAHYSILNHEWSQIKLHLTSLLAKQHEPHH